MTTRTATRTTTLRLLAAAALVVTTTLTGVSTGAGASAAGVSAARTGATRIGADRPANAGEAYVASLVARAQQARPYSQAEDYVDTLVYWHHHPNWGFGS